MPIHQLLRRKFALRFVKMHEIRRLSVAFNAACQFLNIENSVVKKMMQYR